MQCPRCQHANPEDARFCNACGATLDRPCAACGHVNPPGSRFCNACGQPLVAPAPHRTPSAQPATPAQERAGLSYTPQHLADKILTSRSALEGERKQVTVLFADVAGFSAVSEQLDAEAVHIIMDGCFDLLTRQVHHYEGTINQFTGDGIMALFGAPITHEEHAIRALHAALDIQAALREYGEAVHRQWGVPLQMRLGLNTGTVVVGRIGDDLRMDYTAQGDTTNLAARMQQMASPGDIWVAEATYRVARDAFAWQALGLQKVKGKTAPVTVYALRGRRDGHGRFDVWARRGLTPLVGREPERSQLREAWAQAQHGQGRVVSIVGEAGLGKSRLVYEFKQRLRHQGARCVEGTCFTYGDSISYLPFLEIVQAMCELEAPCSEAEAKRRIARRLDVLGLSPSTVMPYLHNLLSLPVEDDVFPKLTPELIRRRTVAALKTLVMAEAHHQPLALVLEDVHWMDKATEDVLGTLVEAMTRVPLLLVLVYRPAYGQSWVLQAIHTKTYANQVELHPLAAGQRTEMTQALLGAIPPDVEAFIVDKTDGNPLFVEELCRSLVESGMLAQEDGRYIVHAPLDVLDIPTTLQGVLLARIDRLPEALKDVLQRAAVIGRVFTRSLLSHVVDDEAALELQLAQLEQLAFIYPSSLAPQREYSFKHVLTQEAVYQTLLRPRREAYHERVGKAIETLSLDRLEESYELLAYHYGRGGTPDKAVEYLDLANQKATRANAMEEAKTLFDRAMTFLDSLPETKENRRRRITLLVNQQTVMTLLLQYAEYYDLLTRYESIAVELNDPGLLGMYYGRMGWGEWGFSHLDQAIQTLTKAAALCEDAGNTEDAAQAHLLLQWSHLMQGDFDQSLASHKQVLRLMQQQFHLRWSMWTVTGAARSYIYLGRWEAAVAEARKGMKIGEEFSDDSLISFSAWTLSLANTAKGDLERAFNDAELALAKAPTPLDTLWSQSALAWAWSRSGEPHKAIEILSQTVPMQRAAPWISSEWFAFFLGEAYWLAGNYDKARQILEENLDIAKRAGMKFYIGATHRLLGEVALGDTSAPRVASLATPHFEQSIAILREIKAENELALAYAGYGRLHAKQGNVGQARDYLTRALDIFTRLGTLGAPDIVSQALAGLPEA